MAARMDVEYFAYLRERRGTSREQVETEAATPRELFRELSARHNFDTPADSVQVAVNDEMASWDRRLADGDRIVFLTPFGGG